MRGGQQPRGAARESTSAVSTDVGSGAGHGLTGAAGAIPFSQTYPISAGPPINRWRQISRKFVPGPPCFWTSREREARELWFRGRNTGGVF